MTLKIKDRSTLELNQTISLLILQKLTAMHYFPEDMEDCFDIQEYYHVKEFVTDKQLKHFSWVINELDKYYQQIEE